MDQSNQYTAPELKKYGKCSYGSDVYSLGKIFAKIDKSGMLQQTNLMQKKIDGMIEKMIDDDIEKRLSLSQVQHIISIALMQMKGTVSSYGNEKVSIRLKSAKSMEQKMK